MHWLFGKKRPKPRCLSPITDVSPIDFCCLTVTVSDTSEPEYGVDYLRINDSYYSWLLPYMEAISESTGKKIDLFDDVSFSDNELAAIEFEIKRALEDPDLLQESVKIEPVVQDNPDGSRVEHPRSLKASEMRDLLRALLEMAAQAGANGKHLSFRGQ